MSRRREQWTQAEETALEAQAEAAAEDWRYTTDRELDEHADEWEARRYDR